MTNSSWALRSACVAALALPTLVLADGNGPIFITGSLAERAASEVPYSVTVIDRKVLRESGPMVNLSEAMAGVPGFVVSNRSNYAQDLQINSRGFGARASFGVRGVRLYEDGIPATGPDGQGQVAQFDLAGADRIEVLRGPFSVLYGNSSGGVISLERAPVRHNRAEGEIDAGSFGLRQLRAALARKLGAGLDLSVSASAMGIDGFRPHSAANRRLASLRLGWQGGHDRVTLLVSHYAQPAQDPLGLTRALFNADPLQTASQASQFDTRKASDQTQIGSTWKHRFDEGALREARVTAYFGSRSVSQFQAIPAAAEAAATSPGGVVAFDRSFDGLQASLRWAWETVDLQAGLAADDQRDARKGYLNYTTGGANPNYGVQGALRRNETDFAHSRDAFAQGEWAISPTLTASLGVRSGHVTLASKDYFLANGDDSGSSRFGYTNPVAGLRWQPARGLQLYASAARGIETPTLNDVAYLPNGQAGINTGLRPQISDQAEAGVKWRGGTGSLDFTVFQAKVANEIVVESSTGGRTVFENAPHTMRKGFEIGAGWQLAPAWHGRLALGVLGARY
ncbi:MAG: TonB-dependent receptor, partial [Burkholderiales bacterium]|nr:TonB-dependent receptor [Burkholderiales bacterium]